MPIVPSIAKTIDEYIDWQYTRILFVLSKHPTNRNRNFKRMLSFITGKQIVKVFGLEEGN